MSKWCWCLENENGQLLTGWVQVGDYWYYLKPNGAMSTGWLQDPNSSKWYYLNSNGQMQTGWLKDDNKWYYLEPNSTGYKGAMYQSCTASIDGKDYTFDSKGVWQDSLASDSCIDFIKSWEGFSSTPYFDEVGVKTLGYGMTGEEIEGISSITEEEATNMLKDWIERKYAPVIKQDLDSKGIVLKQNEFDSLVSMAYNVGTSGVLGSTLYRNICNGVMDSATITANFQAWSMAGGKRLEGLYKRRTKEANMFLNADYTGNC